MALVELAGNPVARLLDGQLVGNGLSGLLAAAAGPTGAESGGGFLDMLAGLQIYIPLVIANLVVFLLFFAIIRRVLFERVRAHMVARRAELAQGRAEVAKLEVERDAARAALAAEQATLDKLAYERTQEQVRKGLERKAEAVQRAQDASQERVRDVRRQCAAEEGQALMEGRDVIRDLALEMVRIASAGTLEPRSIEGDVTAGIDRHLQAGAAS